MRYINLNTYNKLLNEFYAPLRADTSGDLTLWLRRNGCKSVGRIDIDV